MKRRTAPDSDSESRDAERLAARLCNAGTYLCARLGKSSLCGSKGGSASRMTIHVPCFKSIAEGYSDHLFAVSAIDFSRRRRATVKVAAPDSECCNAELLAARLWYILGLTFGLGTRRS